MILKEFINLIGYDIDEASFTRAQSRIDAFALRMGRIGNQLSLMLSAPIAAATTFALKNAAEVEQAATSFEVFIGNADKAKKVFQDLVDFAVKTPFRFRGVVQSANMLLAMGESADTLVETMQVLGTLSRGKQDILDRVALAYGQIMTAGRLKGGELRQLTEAGIGILPELSKLTGIDQKKLSSDTGRLSISADVVRQAMVNMTSKGGRYYGLLEKQMMTISGLFSNLADTVYFLSAEFGNQIVQILKLHVAIPKLTNFLGKLLKNFKELDPAQQRLIMGLTLFAAAIGPILVGLSLLIKMGSFVITTFQLLATAIAGAEAGLAAMLMNTLIIPGLIAAAIIGLFLLIDELIVWMKGGETFIGDWIGPFSEYEGAINKFIDKLKYYYEIVKKDLKELRDYVVNDIVPPIRDSFLGLRDIIKGLWSDDVNQIQEGVAKIIPAVWKLFSALVNGVAYFIMQLFDQVMNFLVDITMAIIKRGSEKILDAISAAMLGIWKIFNRPAKPGTNDTSSQDNSFIEKDLSYFDSITNGLKNLGKSALANLFSPLSDNERTYNEYLSNKSKVGKDVKEGTDFALNGVSNFLNNSMLPAFEKFVNYTFSGLAMTPQGPALVPANFDFTKDRSSSKVELTNNIKIEVPPGTNQEQVNFLEKTMRKIAQDTLSQAVRETVTQNKGSK